MDGRIVITGVGVICPIGENYERFARNLLAGQGGIARHAGLFSGQEI